MSGFGSGFTDDEENDYQRAILQAVLAKVLTKNEAGAARGQAGMAVDSAPNMTGDRLRHGAMNALSGGGLNDLPTDPSVNKESPFWRTEPGTDMDAWWASQQRRMDRKYSAPPPMPPPPTGDRMRMPMEDDKMAIIKAALSANRNAAAGAVGNAMGAGIPERLKENDQSGKAYVYMHGTEQEPGRLLEEEEMMQNNPRTSVLARAVAAAKIRGAIGANNDIVKGLF